MSVAWMTAQRAEIGIARSLATDTQGCLFLPPGKMTCEPGRLRHGETDAAIVTDRRVFATTAIARVIAGS